MDGEKKNGKIEKLDQIYDIVGFLSEQTYCDSKLIVDQIYNSHIIEINCFLFNLIA